MQRTALHPNPPATGVVLRLPPQEQTALTLGYAEAWREIRALRPGAAIEYHTGLLARDRQSDPTVDGWARGFLEASVHGLGTLCQRRLGDGYAYLFRKAFHPAPAGGGCAAA